MMKKFDELKVTENHKEPFVFEYTVPCMDWYYTENVVIHEGDFTYFRIERRYGPSWWVIGLKYDQKNLAWSEKQLGEMNDAQLKKFIKWAKNETGSNIIDVKAISGNCNIIEDILKLLR